MEKDKKRGMIDMKGIKKKKFEAGISVMLVLALSSVILISGIGSSVSTPPSVLDDKSEPVSSVFLVPHPIFGKAEYEDDGWAVGASVEVVSSEGTLTDTVGSSGEWQVDCGDPGPNWPEGTEFTVWIYGIDEYEGWIGTADGTVTGYYNDMGTIIVSPSESDLECEGSLSWSDVKPGSTVTGSFKVKNVGTPGSKLDWEVTEWPKDWGTGWAFNPLSGSDLTPEDGKVTVQVSVTAPDEKNKEFTGDVIVVNMENSSDKCTIPVYLKTPFNLASNSLQVLHFLQKLRQRFLIFQ